MWSWNSDYEGSKLFFGASLMGMKYIFHFDKQIENAQITAPILGGLATFTDLHYGKGSRFEMSKKNDSIWTRRSYLKDGSQAFCDYFPTVVATAEDGEHTENLKLCLASIKDSPTFDSKAEISGGASTLQAVRW